MSKKYLYTHTFRAVKTIRLNNLSEHWKLGF